MANTAKMAATVDEKLLKATKFPTEFNQKVDMQKVNVEVMKKFVCAFPDSSFWRRTNHGLTTGGLLAGFQKSLVMKMMLSLSFASI